MSDSIDPLDPAETVDMPHGAFSLRDYRPTDAAAVAAVFRSAILETGASAYSAEQCAAWAAAAEDLPAFAAQLQNDWIRIAECDESEEGGVACIGFAAIAPAGKFADITMLYVAPSFARLGVANALCDELDELATAMGARSLRTKASLIAREFFLQRGFKDLGVEEVTRAGVSMARHSMQRA